MYNNNDITNALAGNTDFGESSRKNGFSIQFYHVPTSKKPFDLKEPMDNGSQATFKAFLTDFSDSFKSNWNSKETLGRMDPIQTFKNTTRTITIAFDVPSFNQEEALVNFLELHKLIQMQYPVYEVIPIKQVGKLSQQQAPPQEPAKREVGKQGEEEDMYNPAKARSGNTTLRFMSSPPILYIKFVNWIASSDTRTNNPVAGDSLAGTISDVSFKPDLDHGFHLIDGKLVPKFFNLSLNITVIHLQELGWVDTTSKTGQKLGSHLFGEPQGSEPEGFTKYGTFPYNADFTYYVSQPGAPSSQTPAQEFDEKVRKANEAMAKAVGPDGIDAAIARQKAINAELTKNK